MHCHFSIIDMNRKVLISFMLLSGSLATPLLAQTAIEGQRSMKINSVGVYSVAPDAEVVSYKWLPPIGCRVQSGQDTAQVALRSTFLAQDSPLRLVRSFSDEHCDTLSSAIQFDRYVTEVADHSINEGQTYEINGVQRSVADIYYEPIDGDGQHVRAHRLTVVPTQYADFTQPYLQSATSTSIGYRGRPASTTPSRWLSAPTPIA